MSNAEPDGSDLEALVNTKIKDAIRAAVDKIGEKELSKITGVAQSRIDTVLRSEEEYMPVKVISVICQINRSHGDPNLEHSSVSACLKGTTVRLPSVKRDEQAQQPGKTVPNPFEPRASIGPMYDQKSARILNFGANTLTLMVLSYFLGGVALGPVLGWNSCLGFSFSPLRAEPCLGSVLGLILGAFGSLAYTYYFFTRKL